jgi:hypothetical protein
MGNLWLAFWVLVLVTVGLIVVREAFEAVFRLVLSG